MLTARARGWAQTPSAKQAIEAAMSAACADMADGDGAVTLKMPCVLTVATKPGGGEYVSKVANP